MKTHPSSVPHFLRVAQALTLVSGIGLPAAALLVACGGTESGGVSGVDSGVPHRDGGGVDSGIVSYDSAQLGTDSTTNFDSGPSGPASGSDTGPELDSNIPDVLGVADVGGGDSNIADVIGVAADSSGTDARDEINGILVMPDSGLAEEGGDAEPGDGSSGGGPGFFPDLPA